jgi:uncharacterized membrane protein
MRHTLRRTMRLAFVLLLAFSLPADAAFTVCNKTAHPARVALGWFDGSAWISQGWWTIAAKACESLLPGPLDARYYYLYAADGGSGSWSGARGFCVGPGSRFEIAGRADCAGRGFERKGFFEVDTGRAANYTQSLSD